MKLTPHQLRVLQLLIEGNTIGEIGDIIRRDKNHMVHVFRHMREKYKCRNNYQLVAKAIREGEL